MLRSLSLLTLCLAAASPEKAAIIASGAIQPQLAASEDGAFYGYIPGLDGVWADGTTAESCRATLQEALEEWIMVSLAHHLPIPPVDGIQLAVREVA